jgi:SnoaL-like protein
MSKLTAISYAFSAAIMIAAPIVQAAGTAPADRVAGLEARIALLEAKLERVDHDSQVALDRGAIENVFSNYMYLHNAFHDEQIKSLWAKRGTPGMSAQYSNLGVYTRYESIMAYHSGRPDPVGKLIFHYVTTPSIQVGADRQTAKGLWIAAGVESGLMSAEQAAHAPNYLFEQNEAGGTEVHGKKVWAHWVQMKYGVDFIRQDGEWKIWHFRCFEISRARFDRNWISMAAELQDSAANSKFNADLMYLGDDGKPVFMPPVDAPPKSLAFPYRPDGRIELQPVLPVPYDTFSHTFEY